ncbi:MAG: response regulator [Candidatus Wallbacteria bacterium]|nr:response regulator [Candidatus Wallbacteria bacterium]
MNYTVLVVDDEQFIRQILKEILEKENFQVTLAETGEAALDFLSHNEVDFILLDILLPGIDGMEVLSRLSGKLERTIVIMISGHGNYQHAVAAVKAGAFDFIEKPFTIPILLSALERGKRKKTVLSAYQKFENQKGLHYLDNTSYSYLIKKTAIQGLNALIYGKPGTGKDFIARKLHEIGHPESRLVKLDLRSAENLEALRRLLDSGEQGCVYLSNLENITGDLIERLQKSSLTIFASTADYNYSPPGDMFPCFLYLPLLRELGNREEIFFYLLEKYSRQLGKSIRLVSEEALEIFREYDWPRNFNELQEVCHQLANFSELGIILAANMKNIIFQKRAVSLEDFLAEFRNGYIINTVESLDWNLELASQKLKIDVLELSKIMENYFQKIKEQSGTYSLELTSDFDEIQKAQNFATELLHKTGVPENKMFELKLLIDELLVNAIEHGYDGKSGKIWFTLVVRENRIEVIVTDEGKGFHFQKAELPKDIFSMGGRGLFLAEKIGDEFHLDTAPGKGTEIITQKNIASVKVMVVGEELRRTIFQELKDISTTFYRNLDEVPENFENIGLVAVFEEFVIHQPENVRLIREKLPRFKIVICGEKSNISQSARYVFFGAEDFWPVDIISAKLEVFLHHYERQDSKVETFSELNEFYTVNRQLLEHKNFLLNFRKPSECFVFSGEPGTGREHMADFLSVRRPEFTLVKIDFKKNPQQVLELLAGENRILFVENCFHQHPEFQDRVLEALEGVFQRNNLLIFSGQYGEDKLPKFLESSDYPRYIFKFPSLRQRSEDVPLLANIFLERFSRTAGTRVKNFAMDALVALQNYSWPENVDELIGVVRRCLETIPAKTIQRSEVKELLNYTSSTVNLTLSEATRLAERSYLQQALNKHGGNAYNFLGLTLADWQRKLAEHGIKS